MTRLAIHGAAGRMGTRLVALGSQDPAYTIAAALESDAHPKLGEDAGVLAGEGPIGVPIRATLETDVDAIIDFSVPEACLRIVELARARKIPIVVATTGLDDRQHDVVRAAAEEIPLLAAPNMSLAVNLVMQLTGVAATALKEHPGGADVEIVERHHRFKEDAPSGTALEFGRIVADAMGQTGHTHGRQGRPGVRPRDEIGYHALRVGDDPGRHTIVFGLPGETIELSVAATSRDAYAQGALAAAAFLVGQSPGLYHIRHVLGL